MTACRRKPLRVALIGWGVLLALCTGAFPLLSYLKAKLEPGKHGGAR